MKKLYLYLLLMLPVFALTSCDTDERIANYLINGNWKGNLQTYYVDHWGDALEYAVWHIIHQINGFDKILEAIRAVHHVNSEMAKEVA